MGNEQVVIKVISEITGIREDKINAETKAEDFPEWDSMNHINLVLAFEEKFDASFSPEDIAEMISVQEILRVLKIKGIS